MDRRLARRPSNTSYEHCSNFGSSISDYYAPSRTPMQCPHCKQFRSKRYWSGPQWVAWNPIVTGADGWQRNCCNQCAIEVGWYFTREPSPAQPSPAPSPAQPSPAQPSPAQPSPAQPHSIEPRLVWATFGRELELMEKAARKWLSNQVPAAFWLKFYDLLVEAGAKESWISFRATLY